MSVSGGPEPAVDVAYRKVGDGHPLRLWRVSTEVEAPPGELLQRVLRERHSWDQSLLKWRVVARLSEQTEVFQYVCADMPPLPNRDYCVVRCVGFSKVILFLLYSRVSFEFKSTLMMHFLFYQILEIGFAKGGMCSG